ncbi:MAG: hypothetical protein Q9219_002289 [cf. Caloplaca sp. 3 TL-2023]
MPIPPRCRTASTLIRDPAPLEDVDLNTPHNSSRHENDSDKENREPIVGRPRLSFEAKEEILSINEPHIESDSLPAKIHLNKTHDIPASRSFKRWFSNLRPQSLKRTKTLTPSVKRWPLEDSPEEQRIANPDKIEDQQKGHRKTRSGSSAGFIDAIKVATMVRPTSTPVSRISRRSNLFSRSNRNSKLSEDQARLSTDHPQDLTNPLGEVALRRNLQRQKTMEELLDSEASYIADLKVLIHVCELHHSPYFEYQFAYTVQAYFTLLATTPNGFHRTSAQVHQNVKEILRLHEDLLCQLQPVVRRSTRQVDNVRREIPIPPKHHRHRNAEGNRITSAVAGLVHAARTSVDTTRPTQTISPLPMTNHGDVAAVAKIFEKMLGRFFIYYEYGSQYELMLRDMVVTSKSINNWHAFERSIEALANSLASSSGSEESSKKGLAFEDLLIKPIQRICKYPLLFDELYNNTLEADDAETHADLSRLLFRLREMTTEINQATNDPQTQAQVQRAWRLQDLLILPDVPASPKSLRLLGYPILCGVLYVAWETESSVLGDYALCILFGAHLVLAIQQPDADRYHVVAIIGLNDIQLEKADNGRGLQCHTASFCWKMVFEAAQQLYEIILCACSSKEEQAWTCAIVQQSERASRIKQDEILPMAPVYTILILDAKPLGPIFGLFGSVTRRLAIQRAATVHSKTDGAKVIIRNTTAAKDKDENDLVFSSIGRSKSAMTVNRIPILAPKRSDRSRMESSLSDVWSRDRLPFPGMSTHKGDHPLRASASSMMRRLSRASISSTFSKRSTSTTSCADTKPGASMPDLQKIGEGDDERDPRLDAYQSLQSTPGFSRGQDKDLEGSGRLLRTGMVMGMRLSDATYRIADRDAPRYSAQTVRIESTEKGSPRIVRSRRSIPGGLLKGFSAEGVKAWRA